MLRAAAQLKFLVIRLQRLSGAELISGWRSLKIITFVNDNKQMLTTKYRWFATIPEIQMVKALAAMLDDRNNKANLAFLEAAWPSG